MGALGGRLEGVLRALRTVKAARAEARETGRIALHAERSAEKSIRAVRLEAWAWTITGGGINLAVMLILGVGAYRVAAGDMTVTTLVAFLLYAFQLMMPVMLLTMSLTSVQSGLAAAARIGEINAMATESDEPAAAPAPATTAADAAPEATEDELWTALATVRLDQRVRELEHDLDTVLSPTTMSGGERQRVALARALVTDADLLLLDEATAQLDGLSEAAVAEGIRRQAATGAVVTIAHRLSTVIDADQIVLLEAGRVRAVGTHQQLLDADELYRELVAALRIATAEPEAVTTP